MKRFRLILLLLFVIAFVVFTIFAVLSERRRVVTMAEIEVSPELVFHEKLAKAMADQDDGAQVPPPPELQPALDTIEAWKALFQRKKDEVDEAEWDAVAGLWYEANIWENLSPEEMIQIGAFLDGHRDFFVELRRVAAMGGPMAAISGPLKNYAIHMFDARYTARMLAWDTIYQARTGNSDLAISDAIAGFQLAAALAPEPDLMAQGARFGCTLTAYQAVLESFPPGTLSDTDTARLIHEVQKDPGRAPLGPALEAFVVSGLDELNAMLEIGWVERYTEMGLTTSFSSSPLLQKAGQFAYASPLARPWLNKDIANVSEAVSRVIKVAHLPYHDARRQYDEPEVVFSPYTSLYAQFTFRDLASQARHEVHLQLLQLGLTLEQYSAPPVSLDALSAKFPEETLIDPFTGDHFIYRPEGDSFLLYSVGRNLRDDAARHDYSNGDIVWRGKTGRRD